MNAETLESLFAIFLQEGGAAFLYIVVLVACLVFLGRVAHQLVRSMQMRAHGAEAARDGAVADLVRELRDQHSACQTRVQALENRVQALEQREQLLMQHNTALTEMVHELRRQLFSEVADGA